MHATHIYYQRLGTTPTRADSQGCQKKSGAGGAWRHPPRPPAEPPLGTQAREGRASVPAPAALSAERKGRCVSGVARGPGWGEQKGPRYYPRFDLGDVKKKRLTALRKSAAPYVPIAGQEHTPPTHIPHSPLPRPPAHTNRAAPRRRLGHKGTAPARPTAPEEQKTSEKPQRFFIRCSADAN